MDNGMMVNFRVQIEGENKKKAFTADLRPEAVSKCLCNLSANT